MSDYWQNRKNFLYYQKVVEVIKSYRPTSIIDVGGWQGEFLHSINFVSDKTCLDLKASPRIEDVKFIQIDFLEYKNKSPYDLAVCLQVLEHLDDGVVEKFTQKLFDTAHNVIISVPYLWDKSVCEYHIQDPICLDKLKSWTKREPTSYWIIEEPAGSCLNGTNKRLITKYDGN